MTSVIIIDTDSGVELSCGQWPTLPPLGGVVSIKKKLYRILRIQDLTVLHIWVKALKKGERI